MFKEKNEVSKQFQFQSLSVTPAKVIPCETTSYGKMIMVTQNLC